jgi:hypothetical protein
MIMIWLCTGILAKNPIARAILSARKGSVRTKKDGKVAFKTVSCQKTLGKRMKQLANVEFKEKCFLKNT